MRAIKTTTISILALGLLAGSAVGVAAQSTTVTGSVERFTCFYDDLEVFGQQTETCADAIFETTDRRLNGTAGFINYGLRAPVSDAYEEAGIGTDFFRLENEGGAWSGRGPSAAIVPTAEDEEGFDSATWLLVGAPVASYPTQGDAARLQQWPPESCRATGGGLSGRWGPCREPKCW